MMKEQKPRVCVVIPAYNEATAIREVVENIHKNLYKNGFSFEVVVVNDGSKDETCSEARKGGAMVISHILNSGSGGATATGLSYAEQNDFDIAVTMDADGQHAAEDVVKGINAIQKSDADLLIGSRLMTRDGMSKVKILGNTGLSMITRVLFGINVTDSQSGLRVFSKKALRELKWKTSGYEFCSEMLWRAKQLELKIAEFPIKAIYTDYSRGKGQNNWNAFNIIKVLFTRRIVELFSE